MKRKRLLLFLLIVCVGAPVCFVQSGTGWQIRRVFPGAEPYFAPLNSPNPTISSTIRAVVPSYFGTDESLGFWLYDSAERLDLRARFSRLAHLKFFTVQFTRCKITNLCPTGSDGFPVIIVFDDCDFSELPEDQRGLLQPYDPADPTAAKKFCIGKI